MRYYLEIFDVRNKDRPRRYPAGKTAGYFSYEDAVAAARKLIDPPDPKRVVLILNDAPVADAYRDIEKAIEMMCDGADPESAAGLLEEVRQRLSLGSRFRSAMRLAGRGEEASLILNEWKKVKHG